jgi:predicted DNA-binding protein
MRKTVFLALWIESELKKKLVEQAKREGRTLSNLVRRIILAAAKKENGQ